MGNYNEEQHEFNVLRIQREETDGGFFKCVKTGDYLISIEPFNYV